MGNNEKHQCVTDIVLILNPKHNTIAGTRKKIDSIPGETRTCKLKNVMLVWYCCIVCHKRMAYSSLGPQLQGRGESPSLIQAGNLLQSL